MATRNRGKSQGFTLIEVMVVVALVALLLMMALPLTREWVQSAHQRQTAGMLAEAFGRAKALALRNPQALTDQNLPGAAVCLIGKQLSVVGVGADKKLTCANPAVWTQPISSDASVVLTNTNIPFQCSAYNERGVLLVMSLGSLSCAQASLDVNVGSEEGFNVPLP